MSIIIYIFERMMVVDSIPPRTISIIIFVVFSVLVRLALSALDEVSEARISKLSDNGNKKAEKALGLIDRGFRVSNSLRMLSVVFDLLSSAVLIHSVISLASDYSIIFCALGLLVLAFVIHFFGIILPRKIMGENAEKVMFSLLWLIELSYFICFPFERIMSFVAAILLKPFGIDLESAKEDDVTEEDIRFMVDIGSESGAIEEDEKEMIHNIFELNDTPVKDIMTHRTDVVFLWSEEDINVWEEIIKDSNHSIYPVCKETVDDIIGYVKATDFYKLLRACDNANDIDKMSIVKNAYLVPESIKADDLFKQMQRAKNHFAIVLDEYGGLAGIITVSDLLEEIVGTLQTDSEETEIPDIVRLDKNTWKILGSTEIEKVSEELGIELAYDDFNTFAGLVLSLLGEVPDDGTTAEIEAFGLQIKVIKIEEHRLEEILVCKLEDASISNEL